MGGRSGGSSVGSAPMAGSSSPVLWSGGGVSSLGGARLSGGTSPRSR